MSAACVDRRAALQVGDHCLVIMRSGDQGEGRIEALADHCAHWPVVPGGRYWVRWISVSGYDKTHGSVYLVSGRYLRKIDAEHSR